MRHTTREVVLGCQRRWASAVGLVVDDSGYLGSYSENLRQPLSASARGCFDRGSGSELRDGKSRAAKMRALHSSSALAVNVFDYWGERDLEPLSATLGVGVAQPPIFEVQFPTGLTGTPPNLDIAMRLASGPTLAIESKFCEWMTPKAKSKPSFKEKYFPSGASLWSAVGLPESQKLAMDIHLKSEQFIHFDASQLLKHALGLALGLNDQFSLYYLYYDWPSPESVQHRMEIDRFASRVGLELRFRSMTYQELFDRLTPHCSSLDDEYTEYLRRRYFAQAGTELRQH